MRYHDPRWLDYCLKCGTRQEIIKRPDGWAVCLTCHQKKVIAAKLRKANPRLYYSKPNQPPKGK